MSGARLLAHARAENLLTTTAGGYSHFARRKHILRTPWTQGLWQQQAVLEHTNDDLFLSQRLSTLHAGAGEQFSPACWGHSSMFFCLACSSLLFLLRKSSVKSPNIPRQRLSQRSVPERQAACDVWRRWNASAIATHLASWVHRPRAPPLRTVYDVRAPLSANIARDICCVRRSHFRLRHQECTSNRAWQWWWKRRRRTSLSSSKHEARDVPAFLGK